MNLDQRTLTVAEYRRLVQYLGIGLVCVGIIAVMAVGKVVFLSNPIITLKTPGLPADAVIEKTAFDKKTQMATLLALTQVINSINPNNANYAKSYIEVYFDADTYTKLSASIDAQVSKMASEHELGSRYFVFKRYLYDPDKDRHFVIGELHIVNAAKDTGEPYVYEYELRVENYMPRVVSYTFYKGENPLTAAVLKEKAKAEGR